MFQTFFCIESPNLHCLHNKYMIVSQLRKRERERERGEKERERDKEKGIERDYSDVISLKQEQNQAKISLNIYS